MKSLDISVMISGVSRAEVSHVLGVFNPYSIFSKYRDNFFLQNHLHVLKHVEERCWIKLKDISLKSKPSNNHSNHQDNSTELVFNMDSKEHENQCILDSGIPQHVTNYLHLIYDR